MRSRSLLVIFSYWSWSWSSQLLIFDLWSWSLIFISSFWDQFVAIPIPRNVSFSPQTKAQGPLFCLLFHLDLWPNCSLCRLHREHKDFYCPNFAETINKLQLREGRVQKSRVQIFVDVTHCSGRGSGFDLSSQSKFQQNMFIWCLDYHKIHKWKSSGKGPSLTLFKNRVRQEEESRWDRNLPV